MSTNSAIPRKRSSLSRANRTRCDKRWINVSAELLRHPQLYGDVYDRFDSSKLLSHGLYYLPREQLDDLAQFVDHVVPLLQQPSVGLVELLSAISLASPSANETSAVARDGNEQAAPRQLAVFSGKLPPLQTASIVDRLREQFPNYQTLQDGHLGLVTFHLLPAEEGFVRGNAGIKQVREILGRIQQELPNVELGLTGLPVIEADEMRVSQTDMAWASLASLAGVTLLFAASFGNLREPALAATSLLLGILWTCGYLTLVVGHLNILSISFGVILIGLGIDFAVHYIARCRLVQEQHPAWPGEQSLLVASREVTPAILVGGLTTAVAFWATAVTEFLGLAELGIIAGGGILLCLLATVVVLPVLMDWSAGGRSTANSARMVRMDHWMQPFWGHPRLTLLVGLIATIALGCGCPRVFFDTNLLNLQARGLESIAWEQRLLNQTELSAWYAISLADDHEQLRTRKSRFEQLESVERVEEMGSLLPDSAVDRSAAVRRIHERLTELPIVSPVVTPLDPDDMREQWRRLRQQLPPDRQGGGIPPTVEELNAWRSQLLIHLGSQLQRLREIADPDLPTMDDLPAPLRARFLGQGGRHLIRVYAQGNIWQADVLERFIREIRPVDPNVTGHPLQAYHASHQMRQSYLRAAGWATLGVLLVLFAYLRRLSLVLLATLPTALGMIQLFGLLGWLQIPLNPANLIVLPLIIGIGIDDGVHAMHELRRPTSGGGRWRCHCDRNRNDFADIDDRFWHTDLGPPRRTSLLGPRRDPGSCLLLDDIRSPAALPGPVGQTANRTRERRGGLLRSRWAVIFRGSSQRTSVSRETTNGETRSKSQESKPRQTAGKCPRSQAKTKPHQDLTGSEGRTNPLRVTFETKPQLSRGRALNHRGPIIDTSELDLSRTIADIEEIRRYNPQRFEMEQLTAVVYEDTTRAHVCRVQGCHDGGVLGTRAHARDATDARRLDVRGSRTTGFVLFPETQFAWQRDGRLRRTGGRAFPRPGDSRGPAVHGHATGQDSPGPDDHLSFSRLCARTASWWKG